MTQTSSRQVRERLNGDITKSIWCGAQRNKLHHARCPYDGQEKPWELGCSCICHTFPAHIRARLVPDAQT